MATIKTYTDYSSSDQNSSRAHWLPEPLRAAATSILKAIDGADQTRRTLRRQRYACLLA
jgi:hypothetical protein